MTDQLVLIHVEPEWQLDLATRERGRREVARARHILQQARSRQVGGRAASEIPAVELASVA